MKDKTKKTLSEQLQLIAEHSKNIESHLAKLVEINTKILQLAEFPVKMIWSAESGWRTKEDLERQAFENNKRLTRRLLHRRPSEAMIREWLNEY